MADEIEVAEYDAQRPARFVQESDHICRLLTNPSLEIEHHGSTAVPGLAAKPVIDMLVAVESIERAERYASVLLQNGYESVDQRYRETWRERIALIRRESGKRICHVHRMLRGHSVWKRLVAFRDYLRTHPDVAEKYAELKRSLASSFGKDRHAYMMAKSDFINRTTEIAMHGQEAEP